MQLSYTNVSIKSWLSPSAPSPAGCRGDLVGKPVSLGGVEHVCAGRHLGSLPTPNNDADLIVLALATSLCGMAYFFLGCLTWTFCFCSFFRR